MAELVVWWFLFLLLGAAAWPVAFHLFRLQPGRGYAFAKALGLVILGYALWLLAMFGLVQNTLGGIAALALLGAGASWWFLGRRADAAGETPAAWLRREWRLALAVEVVFALALALFAYYRAFNPEISATEKPMEFAFLNGILKSTTFPPRDPWLSGFSISYYYFGYVMVALLTRLSGIPSSITFNLGLSSTYALAAVGAFGVSFALVAHSLAQKSVSRAGLRRTALPGPARRSPAYVAAVTAVVFLLVIGNLEGFFEVLHSAGLSSPGFWTWLDVNGLASAPVTGNPIPSSGEWWWWRASRVVNDHDPRTQAHVEVIDEFPSFSFLLGDLHPHVLALPFTVLVLAVAFEILLSGADAFAPPGGVDGLRSLFGRGPQDVSASRPTADPEVHDSNAGWLNPGWTLRLLLAALIVGALGFLNTTDLPTFAFIAVAAFALAEAARERAWTPKVWLDTALFAVLLGGLAFLLYSPFYLGFKSQVRGLMPVIFFKTPLQQFLLMFGLFAVILSAFVVTLWARERKLAQAALPEGVSYALVLAAVPLLLGAASVIVLAANPALQDQVASFLGGSGSAAAQIGAGFARILVGQPWVTVLLILLLAATLTYARRRVTTAPDVDRAGPDSAVLFTLLLTFTGFLLAFGVEYVYIRDTFENRMNTVFKLYYQVWTVLSIASAFALWWLYAHLRGLALALFSTLALVLIGMSLVYPVLAYPARANSFQPNQAAGIPTLNGMEYVRLSSPEDDAAIRWLDANASANAVILESPGAQYSDYDRISMATGLPTLLGWGGHELQWRGNYDEPGRREPEIQAIYTSTDVTQVAALLKKYNVRYVFVGPREQSHYSLSISMIDKFKRIGKIVFAQGRTQIFEVQ